MNKPTDQKDTAVRNRKGCIVELCIILVLLILALVPVVIVMSNMLSRGCYDPAPSNWGEGTRNPELEQEIHIAVTNGAEYGNFENAE